MRLSPLFCGTKINQIWRDLANEDVINHPQFGWISPNTLRAQYANTPCPHCLRTMVHGTAYKTQDKEEAENRKFFSIELITIRKSIVEQEILISQINM